MLLTACTPHFLVLPDSRHCLAVRYSKYSLPIVLFRIALSDVHMLPARPFPAETKGSTVSTPLVSGTPHFLLVFPTEFSSSLELISFDLI